MNRVMYYFKQLWFKFLCLLGLRTERRDNRKYFQRNYIEDFINNIDDDLKEDKLI